MLTRIKSMLCGLWRDTVAITKAACEPDRDDDRVAGLRTYCDSLARENDDLRQRLLQVDLRTGLADSRMTERYERLKASVDCLRVRIAKLEGLVGELQVRDRESNQRLIDLESIAAARTELLGDPSPN